ncbi:uncharacterized protein LOC115232082 isoform X1 [Octopus sinensis]|uniref:Uncharacterized protein LOC115232082 isoform X1 n=1 Tax=Octopus sinensis TaxID=2607531 RepID=A0A7E6ELA4_9MOLL|nr:uncharacterized protein LOC115232082 isoform X1 [Octopus sinensis]
MGNCRPSYCVRMEQWFLTCGPQSAPIISFYTFSPLLHALLNVRTVWSSLTRVGEEDPQAVKRCYVKPKHKSCCCPHLLLLLQSSGEGLWRQLSIIFIQKFNVRFHIFKMRSAEKPTPERWMDRLHPGMLQTRCAAGHRRQQRLPILDIAPQ